MLERINRREGFDLFISWIAISIAFGILFLSDYRMVSLFPDSLIRLFYCFILSLLTVGIGFIFHEMAHKFTAIKYGFRAEFFKNDVMLLVALVLAALPPHIVFAAPGATVIADPSNRGISREQNGKISAVGPAVNLLLCIPFAGLLIFSGSGATFIPNLLTIIGMIGLQVNAMIAAFNMIPVSVLDGRKVMAWNIPIFVIMIIASFGTLIGSYYLI